MYRMKVVNVAVDFESTVSLAVPDVWFGHWLPVGGGERAHLCSCFSSQQASWSYWVVRMCVIKCPAPWVLGVAPHLPIIPLKWTWLKVHYTSISPLPFLGNGYRKHANIFGCLYSCCAAVINVFTPSCCVHVYMCVCLVRFEGRNVWSSLWYIGHRNIQCSKFLSWFLPLLLSVSLLPHSQQMLPLVWQMCIIIAVRNI